MSSVTNTLENWRPLCTRKVKPMKSGTTVQSRDQVLIGAFTLADFSIFANKRRSTWGPFFNDRLIVFSSNPTAADNLQAFRVPGQGATRLRLAFAGDLANAKRKQTMLRVMRPRTAAADDRA